MSRAARPRRLDLLRQGLIFHAATVTQLARAKSAARALLDGATPDKWVNGRPPEVSRETEFAFEYEFHFLLVSAQQLDKALGQLGFAGFNSELHGVVKDLRDWYAHFEDPEGRAFRSFINRADGAHPGSLLISTDEIHIGDLLELSTLEAAIDAIGSKLPRYEQKILAEPGSP